MLPPDFGIFSSFFFLFFYFSLSLFSLSITLIKMPCLGSRKKSSASLSRKSSRHSTKSSKSNTRQQQSTTPIVDGKFNPPNFAEPTLSSGINGQSRPGSISSHQSMAVAQIRQEYNELKSKVSLLTYTIFGRSYIYNSCIISNRIWKILN